MKKAALPVMGLVGFLPLLQYHWLCGGEFSLALGAFLLAGGLAAALIKTPDSLGRLPLVGAAAGILFPWLIKGIFFLITLPLSGKGSFLYILFDTDYSLILPLYYPVFLFYFLSCQRPQDAPLLLSLLMLLAGAGLLSFKGGSGEREDYLLSLAGAGAFLILGMLYLIFFRQLRLYHRRPPFRKAEGGLILLLLFLPALFFLFHSYNERSLSEGGGLLRNDFFQFDFSDVLTLQPEIAMSDELVMLFRKEGEAERLLIRRHVLDTYDGERGFYRDGEDRGISSGGLKYEDPGYENRKDVFQEYYLINMNPSASLGLNYPVEIEAFREWEGASFQKVFRTLSRVEDIRRRNLYEEAEILMDRREREEYVYYGEREDIAALAREITESYGSPYGKVRAVEQYLKENYYYSLKPGISHQGDQLGYFLFVSRKGYCSYFAFAMTLMLRSLDIPARVAVGFWVEPDSEVLNFYPVSANQAHAWVEVFFNDKGWIEFDPTSQQMAEGEDYSFGRVDFEIYSSLVEEIIQHGDELMPEEAQPIKESVEKSLKRAAFFLENHGKYIFGFLILLYFFWVFLSRHTPYAGPKASPAEKTVTLYVRRVKQLQRTGYAGDSGETPWEYAVRVEESTGLPMKGLTKLYLKAEFASRFDERDMAGLGILTEEYRKAWKTLSFVRRLMGVFYPLPQIRRHL